MGLLDDLAGQAMNMLGGEGQKSGDVAAAVSQLFSEENGGLQGLVQRFQSAGLGDLINGWISTGPNPQINAQQLQAALGPDLLNQLAQRAGVDPNALLGGLSQHLPALIDQLTPDGNAPSGNALQANLGNIIGQFLGGRG